MGACIEQGAQLIKLMIFLQNAEWIEGCFTVAIMETGGERIHHKTVL